VDLRKELIKFWEREGCVVVECRRVMICERECFVFVGTEKKKGKINSERREEGEGFISTIQNMHDFQSPMFLILFGAR